MDFYECIIQLEEIQPLIWRKLLIPVETTLTKLHDILQIAMGWQNCHLHRFFIKGYYYEDLTDAEPYYLQMMYNLRSQWGIKLAKLNLMPGDSFHYRYDFGDNWRHVVTIENRVNHPSLDYPVCLAGERQCPPENCGGFPGYQHVLNVMFNPSHSQFNDIARWLNGYLEPESFNKDGVNLKLKSSRFKVKHKVANLPSL